MDNIQWFRDFAVRTRSYFMPIFGIFLVFTSAISNAESSKKFDFPPKVTHTRITIHKVMPGESPSGALSKFNSLGSHKIVSFNRDKTFFATISTDRPKEFGGFSNSYGSSNYHNFGRRLNRYTHKFNMMQLATAQGTITSSLSETAKKAGLSEILIDQLTQIFAWDIDFATSLRDGDYFTVVYERGGNNGADDIVAAEFINRGRTYRAVRYIDKEGFANYYTPEGHALQKAFLSTPVDFARISSHFNLHRVHPVLNRIRAHKGVDYAARTGTPVKSTGSGQVTFLGRKGGYGQVIIIKHGERYETVYAHLSKFKAGLQEGSAVRQGEIIGYVGQTGLATGPHLHYEFRIDGVHQNPLTAQAPTSIPVKGVAMAEFKSQIQDPLAKLNLAKANALFAKNYSRYN